MNKKVIGVLGGMGPESTALFYLEMIKACQALYGARYDEDYPEIFIYNLPIPDIVEGLSRREETLNALVNGAKRLEGIGVDFIVMPCNTATIFYEEMKKQVSVDFLSIVDETAKYARGLGLSKVGLLATETTFGSGIYTSVFGSYGIEVIIPEETGRLTKIIMDLLSGKKGKPVMDKLMDIAKELEGKGAEAAILGCTDLSVVAKPEIYGIKVVDSTKAYAEAAIRYSVGGV